MNSAAVGIPTVAIVTGCVVPRDAISNIARQMADALGRPAQVGVPRAEVRIFSHGCEVADTRVRVVPDAMGLAADGFFRTADLIVFHFGIRYPCFDAIQAAPRTARVLAYYHGITPPAALHGAGDRAGIAESYRQANHLHAADVVMTTSRHLAAELRGYGLTDDRILVVPPAVGVAPAPGLPRPLDGPPRFLYVGRFVPSKGVAELVEAFRRFAATCPDAILDLAGSRTFSDPAYLERILAAADHAVLRDRVRFHFDLPSSRLADLYTAADVFVLPSYHEGFGVPIVEALGAGCYVICSDAGACPETAAGLGLVFPAGAVGELADRLATVAGAWSAGERLTADGPLSPADWHQRAAEYAASFSRTAFEERFRAAALAGVRPIPPGLRAFFADTQARIMAAAAEPVTAPPGGSEVFAKFRRLLAETGAAERKAA